MMNYSDSEDSSEGENLNSNNSSNRAKNKIPLGFEIESSEEFEALKKKSHDKVQGKGPLIRANMNTNWWHQNIMSEFQRF